MAFDAESLGLGPTGLPLLRDLIHERTGLFYDNGHYDTLSDRLAPLVINRGFRSFLDFYFLLRYDEQQAVEWGKVMDVLSVPETYFWREIDQIRGFSRTVLPELMRTRTTAQPVRIWSAPCATGEEPLTIAMVLEEDGWFDRVPIEIHASDGSAAAIARARAGQYRARAFRSLPDCMKRKYFHEQDGAATPVPRLSGRITSWSVVNLMAPDEIASHATSPVIFCRNAFIYFSPQCVKRVVEAFADLMPTPAYLFVGASESLVNLTDRFMLDDLDHAFVYARR